MNRWKLTVEYDGSDFVGWQRQDNGPSVQQHLEEAVERLAGETVRVHGAGRTDAGVHALGQVAHFDLEKNLTDRAIRDGLNHHMRPAAITVLKAEPAAGTPGAAPGTLLDGNLTVACADGAVRLTRVQRPGKAAVDGAAFLRGFNAAVGSVLAAS